MSKPLTRAAAKKRLSLYESEIMNPMLAEMKRRDDANETEYFGRLALKDHLYAVHDELRRVAVELEEAR